MLCRTRWTGRECATYALTLLFAVFERPVLIWGRFGDDQSVK
jgi:hypothetical protein